MLRLTNLYLSLRCLKLTRDSARLTQEAAQEASYSKTVN
jgi:hypothetical protein